MAMHHLTKHRTATLICLLAFSLLTLTCGSEADPTAAQEVETALENTYNAFLSGDDVQLRNSVSDQCEDKAEMIETSIGFALSGGAWTIDLPKDSVNVEPVDASRVIVTPRLGAPVPRLNGVPLTEYDPDGSVSYEFEFVREDGSWTLLDCDDEQFKIEF